MLRNIVAVTGHLYNTLYTSTYVHLFPLIQQKETNRETII